jgi:hypothetical protein
MGVCAETGAAKVGGKNGIGSKTHHVGISTQKDRGGTKGAMGEDTGAGEEGGLADWGLLRSMRRALMVEVGRSIMVH